MLKVFSGLIQGLLLITLLSPLAGFACVEGSHTERILDREYSGITALPVARYLNLDDSCHGRRLFKITLWASSTRGYGMATLLVNGLPVGVSRTIGSTLEQVEFKLDPDFNFLGVHVRSIEIRLSGDFYIDRVQGTLSPVPDPWAEYCVYLGKSVAMGPDLTTSVLRISLEANPIKSLLFIAHREKVSLHRVYVYFADGTHRVYGPAYVDKGQAVRIDNIDCKTITRVVIEAYRVSTCDCEKAFVEVRASRP